MASSQLMLRSEQTCISGISDSRQLPPAGATLCGKTGMSLASLWAGPRKISDKIRDRLIRQAGCIFLKSNGRKQRNVSARRGYGMTGEALVVSPNGSGAAASKTLTPSRPDDRGRS